MPLPTPNEGESYGDFIDRCMGNDTMINDFPEAEQRRAVCEKQSGKSLLTDELVAYGGPLKTLGKGKIGGYLIRFTDADHPDLEGDFFTSDTYYGPHKATPVFYHHGQDGALRLKRLDDEAAIEEDEFGKWCEAQLDLSDRYERFIYEQAEAGKMGWSSGTAPHLVEREAVGDAYWIRSWPLGVDATITPTPAEPRNRVVTYKSYLKSLADALGVWLADAPTEAAPEASEDAVAVVGKRHTYVFFGGKQ